MKMNEYQEQILATAVYPKEDAINYLICGLIDDVGKIAGEWQKALEENQINTLDFMIKLSNILYHVTILAHAFSYSLEEIGNISIQQRNGGSYAAYK